MALKVVPVVLQLERVNDRAEAERRRMHLDLLIKVVGTLAGLCSMASFVPQIIKIWREQDASGVSLRMFGVTVTAFALWTTFGVLQGSWPIIVSNAVCLLLAATIAGLRLKFKDNAPAPQGAGA